MNKVAFFTVVYPGVEPYLADFFFSLDQQTFADFDLIVGNDGLANLEIGPHEFSTRVIDLTGTPAEIRDAGIQFLRNQEYEQVVFGDSDDFFSSERVQCSLELLNRYDVVVNDLDLVDKEKRLIQSGYLSHRLLPETEIRADFIRDKNIFGLSNTAAKVSWLPEVKIPEDTVAVDWFLFAHALEGGATAGFSPSVRTFYRQHDANTAGISGPSFQRLEQSVRVKALHYTAMAATGCAGKPIHNALSAVARGCSLCERIF